MSYILDALRKSESERRQGRVPNLSQQVQLIHKPRKRTSMTLWVVAAALLINAGVLAYVFWPAQEIGASVATAPAASQVQPETAATNSQGEVALQSKAASTAPNVSDSSVDATEAASAEAAPQPDSASQPDQEPSVAISGNQQAEQQRPTIIVPSRSTEPRIQVANGAADAGPVPHLVELPLSFQRSIPDLIFNSHIYASEPASRRVMINNNYLRAGDSFDGILVKQITEEGVVLSRNGQAFRVGIVRDWVSPQ